MEAPKQVVGEEKRAERHRGKREKEDLEEGKRTEAKGKCRLLKELT